MRQSIKEIKESCLQHFKQQTIGDINNTKNQKYLKKLKSEFHIAKENAHNKNNEIVIRSCRNMLDQLLQTIKSKSH